MWALKSLSKSREWFIEVYIDNRWLIIIVSINTCGFNTQSTLSRPLSTLDEEKRDYVTNDYAHFKVQENS